MKIKNTYIPLVPIIAFILMNVYYFLPPLDEIFDDDTLPRCEEQSTEFCESTVSDDHTPPQITPVHPEEGTYGIHSETIATFEICDDLSGVDMQSVMVSIYTPGIDDDYNEYSISDTEVIEYSRANECYNVMIDYPEGLPENNSVHWGVTACDCAGNPSESTLYANTTSTRAEHLLIEFSYYATYLIMYLVLFGPKLFERSWGVVYDSVTKTPLSRAVVRLYQNKELVDSSVTNINGVFHITPPKGTYTITTSKSGYTFPSTLNQELDGKRKNLYYGEEHLVEKDGLPIKISIPIDPESSSKGHTITTRVASYAVSTLTFVSDYILMAIIIGVGILWLKPPWVMESISIMTICFLILAIKRYIVLRTRGKVGKVVDSTGKPLSGIELGIYDATYDRLVDKQTSGKKGLFQFVVPGGKYNIRSSNPQFVLDAPDPKGLPVGRETDEDILISPKIVVQKTSV